MGVDSGVVDAEMVGVVLGRGRAELIGSRVGARDMPVNSSEYARAMIVTDFVSGWIFQARVAEIAYKYTCELPSGPLVIENIS